MCLVTPESSSATASCDLPALDLPAYLDLCQRPTLCQLLHPELKIEAEAVKNRPQVDDVTRPKPQSSDDKCGHGGGQLRDHGGMIPADVVIHVPAEKTGGGDRRNVGTDMFVLHSRVARGTSNSGDHVPALPLPSFKLWKGRLGLSYLRLELSSPEFCLLQTLAFLNSLWMTQARVFASVSFSRRSPVLRCVTSEAASSPAWWRA